MIFDDFYDEHLEIDTLSCYQCSMKYSNAECNANNSTYFTECQPTYDTCLTMVLKPGRSAMFEKMNLMQEKFRNSRSINNYQILYKTSSM